MIALFQYIAFASSLYGAASDSIPTAVSIQRIFPREYVLPAPRSVLWKSDSITVQLFAREFNQGNIVYLEIIPKDKIETDIESICCTFGNVDVYLTPFTWGYRGFFALPPDTPAGEKVLELEYQRCVSPPVRDMITFTVGKSDFPMYHQSMNVGKFSDIHHASDPQVQSFIERCSARKKEVFSLQSENLLTSVLAYPRDHHYVTSQFWSTRIYERYEIKNGKKVVQPSETKCHRGVDFRGTRGDPVYALADGRVVLAEKMYYEGNFTVIDHGNRIFSHYMHQDTILVKEGQLVRGGEKIGTVGSTGVSTGPHLHVSLVVNGTQVDPLSILPLPIKN
jgi:murein DD-endopeptidase MepM/ murein hydrolase activator NlpD